MEETTQTEPLERQLSNTFLETIGGGDEELLKVAGDYALQFDTRQVQGLCILHFYADVLKLKNRKDEEEVLRNFIANYIRYKKNNNSDIFIQRTIDSISLRKFISEKGINIDIKK